MKIYTPDNQLLLDILVDDESYRLREIMGANNLELRFTLPEYIPIIEGSYCDFQTERYWMPRAVDYVKEHSEKFSYTLSLEGSICFLKSTKFKFFDYIFENGIVKPTSAFKLKFPITATPRMIVDLLVANLKLKYPEYPWAVGECIDSEPVVIDFNHDFCFDVLPKLADKFNTEWELDKYTFHIRKVEKMKNSAIDLSYGYNNGILGGIRRIQYDDKRIINRVYIEGGDRNIDRSTYGNDTLLLPKNKRITHQGIEYTTDSSGSFLERINPLAGEEDSLDVSKFYPKRVGIVSEVEEINDKQGFYNIIDNTIPAILDYSKLIIAGETMTIIFQTGQLSGKEFDVKYNHDKRRFEIVPIEENGLIYPQGNIIPAVGDTYAVFHMRMPDTYISDAENEALQETVKYLWENEQPQYSYRWQLDGIYAKRNWGAIRGYLDCGYFVKFSDPQFLPESVNVRIVAVKEPVNDLQSPEITIANKVSSRTLGSVINEIPTTAQTIDRKDKEIIKYAKRGWKDTQELIEAVKGMVDDFENSELSADVFKGMVGLFGSTSLQFQFLDDDWVTAINPFMSFDPQTKQFTCHATKVQHMTLGVDSVQPNRSLLEYKFWTVSEYISPILTESSEPYFLYLKASKTYQEKGGRNIGEATFFISTEKIKLDDIEGYYTLWVGYLNSENMEGDRSFRTMYGYTEVLPGQITVDKLLSTSGALVIDLLNGVISAKNGATIQGNIKFISNNGSYQDVGDEFDKTNDKIDNIQIGGVNLVSNLPVNWEQGAYSNSNGSYMGSSSYIRIKSAIQVLPDTEYTISLAVGYNIDVHERKADGTFIKSHGIRLFKTGLGTERLTFNIYKYPMVSIEPTEIVNVKFQIEKGNKATEWSPSNEDVKTGISEAKTAADNAQSVANTANQNVNNLNTYVDGAFKDGVIDNAEAKAIEKYLNTLDETMAQVEATYNKVYANSYLEGTAKSNLLNAKINLFGARDNLKASINNAIADGTATPTEKADVDIKFATFNSYLKAFQNAVEDANKAIQDKLDSLSTDKINNLQIGGANLVNNTDISKNIAVHWGVWLAGSIYQDLGSYLKYTAGGTASTGAISPYINSGLTKDQSYTVSFMFSSRYNWKIFDYVYILSSVGNRMLPSVYADASNTDWHYITFSFVADKDYPDARILLGYTGTNNGNVGFIFKDFQVEKGNKATSWSPSRQDIQAEVNEAKTAATNAQNAANNAKSTADAATSRLNDWASDVIISPTEKTALRQQLADIQSEYQDIASQTYKYGLNGTSEWANYYTGYSYAVSALTKYTAVNPENIAVGSDYSNIAAYYPKRQSILDKIASAAKAYAENLVDNLQIGGVNLVSNLSANWQQGAYQNSTGNYLGALGDYICIKQAINVLPNTQYITSIAQGYAIDIHERRTDGSFVKYSGGGLFTTSADTSKLTFNIRKGGNSINPAEIANIKFQIEKGNKVTDWKPSNEDVQAQITELDYIKTALANRTEIDGGLLLTSLLKLGTFSGNTFNEKAGINGTATGANDVVAWFGGSLQQAIQNLASIVFRMDGSGQLAKGNISWNSAGDTTHRGKFETIHNGNRIAIDPSTNSIKMYNNVNGTDFEILNISWEDIGFGLRRPKLVMKEYSTSDYSVVSSVIISTQKIGFYRYGDENAPYFEVAGTNYSQKRIRIGSFVLPTTKPTTSITMWRDGENLKITP